MRSLRGATGGLVLPILSVLVFAPIASPARAQDPGPTVHLRNGYAAAAIRSAIQGASRRLAKPSCRELFGQFTDADGHTLQANLDARGLWPESQLQSLHFEDGVVRPLCGKAGIHAVTRPGTSLVYICSDAFLTAHRRNPYLAESYIIHELLHTLGLGENPPSSREITDRVAGACRN